MTQVPAATRTLAILQTLATAPGPMPAVAIARQLSLPRSSTYHLLQAMANTGFVVHLPEEERWGLGLAAFEIGAAYLRHDPLERLARPLLQRLLKDIAPSNAVAHLAVLHGNETLYLLKELPKRRIDIVTDIGVRLPAALTASGRAMLAELSPAQLRVLFQGKRAMVTRTTKGPGTLSELTVELERDRRRGYSSEDGYIDEGFASVASCVHDHLDQPVAAIGLTFESADIPVADRQRLASAARDCARLLSKRLGGQ